MGKGKHLGEFEQAVLLTVAGLRGPGTSRGIYDALIRAADRDVSVASVHVTLTRLAAKGYVDTHSKPGRGGNSRHVQHFELTATGGAALNAAREQWDRLWASAQSHPAVRQE